MEGGLLRGGDGGGGGHGGGSGEEVLRRAGRAGLGAGVVALRGEELREGGLCAAESVSRLRRARRAGRGERGAGGGGVWETDRG